LLSSGIEVDILRLRHNSRGKKPTAAQLQDLPPGRFKVETQQPGLRVFQFGTRTKREGLQAVKGYLASEHPAALFASRGHRENIIASRLKFDPAFRGLRVVLGVQNADYANMGLLERISFRWFLRRYYGRADTVITASNGLAQGLQKLSGLQATLFRTIYNPVLTPELFAKATEVVDHPWFQPGSGVPVILGAGVLCEQKDFATLIRAFTRLRELRPVRLVILGDGPERPALQKLVQSLGIDQDVDLPGFVGNPYSYMARANLFVLSSAW
jgi:glycosyltransferase involved in cell wall biosynthesis